MHPDESTILLFRPSCFLWIFVLLFSLNMYGWDAAGVNSVLIFELNPRDRLNFWHMLSIASVLCLMWSICLLGYVLLGVTELITYPMPIYIFPLALNLLVFTIFIVRNPFGSFNSTRVWLQQVFLREIMAGFVPVTFVDFWLADQFNSLVAVFLDVEFFICFLASHNSLYYESNEENDTIVSTGDDWKCGSYWYGLRYFVACYPAYIRFAQCIRRYIDSGEYTHLYNATKYSTSFLKYAMYAIYEQNQSPLVITFWWISNISASTFTLYWDLVHDWGFLNENSKNFMVS